MAVHRRPLSSLTGLGGSARKNGMNWLNPGVFQKRTPEDSKLVLLKYLVMFNK